RSAGRQEALAPSVDAPRRERERNGRALSARARTPPAWGQGHQQSDHGGDRDGRTPRGRRPGVGGGVRLDPALAHSWPAIALAILVAIVYPLLGLRRFRRIEHLPDPLPSRT